MSYKCLIVEDELPAQKLLQKYISEVSYLELKDTCTNAIEAMKVLQSNSIDILFLDIYLPKINGVDFLKTLKTPPQTIFTTAYSEYAVEGFELDAVDYLLKPFSFERFLKAIDKAIQNLENVPKIEKTDKASSVFFKADKKIYRVNLDDLLYIEALKDYVKLITVNEKHIVMQTMKRWEQILPDNLFKRAHKSFIVNLEKIDSIAGNTVQLGEHKIPIGRHYRDDFIKEIERRFIN